MTGSTMKWWRSRLHMTQAELARAIGVHRVTVADWERGSTPIPAMVAKLIPLLGKKKGGSQ